MATATKKKTDPQSLGLVPLDDAPPPRVKKKAVPDFSPEALGLVPLENDAPAPEPDDWSPTALGLIAQDEPPPQPAPAEDESWGDWGQHKLDQFVSLLQDTLGIDRAPPPASADMTVVEDAPGPPQAGDVQPGKITPEGSVPDMIIPDFVEGPIRGVYDWWNSPRTQRSLDAGGAAMVSQVDKLGANAVMVMNYLNDFLVEETGIGQTSDQDDAILGQSWQEFEQQLRAKSESYARKAAYARVPDDERTVADALTEALPQIPSMLVEFGGAAYALGPIGGFAAIEAMMHADEGPEAAAWAGAKGAAMGAFFEWANILSRPLRIPALAAAGGGITAAEGGSDSDIAAQAILFPLLGLPARGGPIGAKYLREHGVTPDLREFGAHVRDLLVGGNVGRAKQTMDDAAGTLNAVRAKHHEEVQAEQARLAVEISAAKGPQPGELTPAQADIDARISRAQAESQTRMEEIRTRQMKAETEARHAYETANRRYRRALRPFTTSFAEAPYARALQSAERRVLVENQRGYEQIQSANKAADERFLAARQQAEEIRAREAKTPEEKAQNDAFADHMDAEGRRLAYEMRRRVEDTVEARIAKAEHEAEVARTRLAEVIARRNPIEGRRARVMVAERDVQEASRSGIRRLNRGNERAKRLIEMGDAHIARVEARLRERGITKDDPNTGAEYDAAMLRANEVRGMYREVASQQLLEAQYAADSRVSRAQLRRDLAIQAAETAGVDVRKLSRKKAEDQPDLPDEPDGIRRGPEYEHAYRKALEASRDDPMIAEIAREFDPILERIQDPADVLPAINRIAKDLQHNSPSRRGKQTAAKREILAEQLGMSEKEFLDSPYGKAFSDYEIEAAMMLLRRQWKRVQDAYAASKSTGGKVEAETARLELMRFLMIVERLRGVAAEAGRALRMFREVKKEFGGITDTLTDRALEKIMTYDNPGKAYRIAQKIIRGDFMGALIEWYIMGLLSSFQTAFVNIYSGLNMVLWKPAQTAIAASIGLTRWAVYNTVLRPIMAPLKLLYRSLATSGAFGRNAAENARQRLKEGRGTADLGRYPDEFAHRDRIRFGEVGARFRGFAEAFFEAPIVFMRTLLTGEKYLDATNFGRGYGEHIPWYLGGHVIRLPGRVLQAIDDFFKVFMYRSAIRAHAYRQAWAESGNLDFSNPIKGYAQVRQRYHELMRNPNGKILAEAKREALEGTFQQDVAPGMRGIQNAIIASPWTRVLVPFTKILFNSTEFLLSGTPLFPLFKRARADIFGTNGRARQDMAIANFVMITGGAAVVYAWAMQGNVRPGYSQDQKGRNVQSVIGPPPLAVRIPGTDQWVTLNRVDPLGGIIALGANAANVSKIAAAQGDEKASERAWSVFMAGAFQMVADRAGMRGLIDFLDAFRGGSFGTQTESLDKWVQKLAATFVVPQGVAVAARTEDPYLRYANTTMEQIMNRTFDRSKLWPVRNMWGSPIKAYDSYGWNDLMDLTQPFYWGTKTKDPASLGVVKLYEIYGWAPGSLTRFIEGRRLTDAEYDYYAQAAGQRSYEGMKRLTQSQAWQEADAIEAQIKQINKQLSSPKETSSAAYKALEKQRADLREDLRKRRFALLNQAKEIFSGARKAARQDTRTKFPDLMQRERVKDPSRNSGEVPTWAEGWFEAEGDAEQFQADEDMKGLEGDGISDIERREQEKNAAAMRAARQRRGLNPAVP